MDNHDTVFLAENERTERLDSGKGEVTPPLLKIIGVDTGGTFTDIVMRIDGDLFYAQSPFDPPKSCIRGDTRRR